MTTHTIHALCERSHDIAREKGWVGDADPRPFYTQAALMHSELSEALEDYRNHKPLNEVWYEAKFREEDGTISEEILTVGAIDAARKVEGKYGRGRDFLDAKPCGIPIELADFVIRVCQSCGTAKLGGKLDDIFQDRRDVPLYKDLEELLAEVHLSVSLAFNANKHRNEEDCLQHLADALSEVFMFCSNNAIDLWAAIDEKEAYNRTRGYKHGGKKV